MLGDFYDQFVVYFVLSSICVFLNIIVVLNIAVKRFQTPFISLFFYFHISIIGDVITALPYAFKSPKGFCVANESFKFYFGLMNLLIIFFLIQAHRMNLFHEMKAITPRLRKIATWIIFLFPLIAFLPYVDDAYEESDGPWCILSYDHNHAWVIMVQYLWIFVLSAINLITNIYIISSLLKGKYDSKLLIKYFLNVVSYSIVALISWIPRIREIWNTKVDDDDNATVLRFYQYYPVAGAGIGYVILFYINRTALLRHERDKSNADDTMHFDTNELLSIVQEQERDKSSLSAFLDIFSDYFNSFSIRPGSDVGATRRESIRNSIQGRGESVTQPSPMIPQRSKIENPILTTGRNSIQRGSIISMKSDDRGSSVSDNNFANDGAMSGIRLSTIRDSEYYKDTEKNADNDL